MFKVLIIEDDVDKLRDIYNVLQTIPGIESDSIESVIDATSGKRFLKEKQYDLVILDISIPSSKSKEVDPLGGIALLDEIVTRPGYKFPTHIFGLTSHDDIFEKVQEKFQQNILTIIKYELSSSTWSQRLASGVKYRIQAKETQKDKVLFDYDVAILCAIQIELDAYLNNGLHWEILPYDQDDTIYYSAKLSLQSNLTLRVVAACLPRMGMPTCACVSMKIIAAFKPRYLVMTGILAGIKERVSIGDLIVASPVWDWGSGKWVPNVKQQLSEESGLNSNKPQIDESLFQIDPLQYILDSRVYRAVSLLANKKDYLYKLRTQYHTPPKHDIKVHIGAVASGAAVLSDINMINRIKIQHRKLLGVEMEAYALFSAADNAPRPKPIPICIKSVVDFGDVEKSDDFQSFGSFLSSQFLIDLLEYLFENEF